MNILNKDIKAEIKKLKVHVQKGCLSNIPPGGSTSRNERLHKDLNKVASSRLGVELAYTRIFRMFYHHNKNNDVQLKTVYDTRKVIAKEEFTRMMQQNKAKEIGSLTECAEIFGIRPKAQHPQRTCSSDKNEVKSLKEFDYNILMDTHNSLQLLIKDHEVGDGDDDDDGDDDEDEEEKI